MLCSTLIELADRVWRDLGEAEGLGFSLSEESITDYMLLELLRRHSREVHVQKFTKHQERAAGADWEWWFVGRRGNAFGMRVQAKRLQLHPAGHRHYPNVFRPYEDGTFQIDNLIKDAGTRLFPCYCFYNYISDADILTGPPRFAGCDACWTWTVPSLQPRPRWRKWGCTLASAERVKKLKVSPHLLSFEVERYSMPLACAVCCPEGEHTDLDQRAYLNVSATLGDGLDVAVPKPSQPPQYVTAVMHERPAENVPEGIAGVLVIADRGPQGG